MLRNSGKRTTSLKRVWKTVKEGETYTFYDGPPTANGKPHIGHVLTRVIKDMIPRYRTMKGCMVPRKAGWDTHGLPVELEVEKMLGLDGKDQIEEYGLVPFIDKCKESVWKYKGMWEDFSNTVGFWADMKNPYVTYDDNYIESEWWALKTIWEKGLLYKGFKIVPYCPRNWIPESIGKGRFGDWLENVQDWGISRNRYWGTPLNIWELRMRTSAFDRKPSELFEMSGNEKAKTVELHRPYIDEITIKCPKCGKPMHRVPEVIDCWFDSGFYAFCAASLSI